MTDLERAQWAIRGEPETWVNMIAMHLCAVRQEHAAEIRERTLAEAAHECDEEAKATSGDFRDGCETCAAAIRALKEH